MNFRNLADHQIRKAQMEGQLDNLKGAGKPLPARPAGGAESVGFGIMAEAGVLPREIELKKAADAQLLKLQSTTGDANRKREMAKLADLQLRYELEREARKKFYGSL